MSALGAIDPLPRTRRGWVITAIIAVIFLTSYFLVVAFYSAEGGSRIEGGVGSTGSEGLLVTIKPDSVDARRNVAAVHLVFEDQGSGLIDDDGRLSENVRITVGSSAGLSETIFPEGTALGQLDTSLALVGEEADYPFDRHRGVITVVADTYVLKPTGALASTGTVPIGMNGQGGVNGWDTTLNLTEGMAESVSASVTYDRAFSTQVFALLIIFLAGVLALMALAVGLLVQAGKRPAEAALLSWTAALLFALPALRSYLPNGPAVGASIDIYAYLWILVAAGFAAVMVILGWSAQRRSHAEHGAA